MNRRFARATGTSPAPRERRRRESRRRRATRRRSGGRRRTRPPAPPPGVGRTPGRTRSRSRSRSRPRRRRRRDRARAGGGTPRTRRPPRARVFERRARETSLLVGPRARTSARALGRGADGGARRRALGALDGVVEHRHEPRAGVLQSRAHLGGRRVGAHRDPPAKTRAREARGRAAEGIERGSDETTRTRKSRGWRGAKSSRRRLLENYWYDYQSLDDVSARPRRTDMTTKT